MSKDKTSRRTFVNGAFAAAIVGVAGGLGSAVGFAPTRAEAAVPRSCDFGAVPLSGCRCRVAGQSCSCIGNCSDTISECQFGARARIDICGVANSNPNNNIGGKAYGTCSGNSAGSGWCCGVWC